MRITIVQGAFYPVPPLRGGAVERFWFDQGQAYAAEGHEVLHLSRRCDDLPEHETIGGVAHLRLDGFDFVQNPVQMKWRDLIYSRRVLARLPAADLLVTNTFWLPLLLRDDRFGKVYVHVARFPKGHHRFYAAARFQAVSEAVACALRSRLSSANAAKVKVLPYAVREGRPSLQAAQSRTLLFAGRLHPEKGIHLLVRAFARLAGDFPELKLRIIGPWREDQGGAGASYLEELQRELGAVAARIEWVPPIFDYARLQEEYQQASLFVYPSLAETGESFGLAPLEAMSCGCPVLVSNLDCFRDYLRPGENGWTFDHRAMDPIAQMEAALRSCLKNPDVLQAGRARAAETAQRFSVRAVAGRFLEDFAEILNK